jgi:hypothetical protein
MTDLIKRDDALAAVNGWHQITHIRAALEAVPLVTTHHYAGESEASVYDRKGFPPIEIAAADRIEELEERNKELTLQLLAAHGQAADALDKFNSRPVED